MNRGLLAAALLVACCVAPSDVRATDTDGPDCGRPLEDFGDAPENTSSGGLLFDVASFPSCLLPGPIGDVEFIVTPRGTAPGPAGFVRHVQSGAANYWIGCYSVSGALSGIDSEPNSKFSLVNPTSDCQLGLAVDCVSGDGNGQDECALDGDGGVSAMLIDCSSWTAVSMFNAANCGPDRTVYLNVLIDLNVDGDWNDNIACANASCVDPCPPGEAAHEWAVKNVPVLLPTGCSVHTMPPFETGALGDRQSWTRVSLTDEPVDDDYPWAGSANRPDGNFLGGETEDLLVIITTPLPARKSTWGELKIRYR